MTAAATSANAAGFSSRSDDVFGRIAGRYDLLCDLFSLGAHRLWKRALVRRIGALPGDEVLDLASGTGDIPARLGRDRAATRRIRVTDLSPQMLAIAAAKLEGALGIAAIEVADAEALEGYAPAAFDIVSMAFAMKICDRAKVMASVLRVLRPGGVFLRLEAARIPFAPLHGLYLAYMRACIPLIARVATGGDRSAYDYLLRGVHEFPPPQDFAAELAGAGFTAVTHRELTFGIVSLHEARKP